MPLEEGMIEGSLDFMGKTDLHPWRNALILPQIDGICQVGVMNTTGENRVINKNTRYGEFKLVSNENNAWRFPWRIETITEPQKSTAEEKEELPPFMKGPTTPDNKRERIKHLINHFGINTNKTLNSCLLYTSPSPRDLSTSRMPSSA